MSADAAPTVEELRTEVRMLQRWIDDCQRGMYINCVYCGHRYGPDDGNHLKTMREALHAHVENCVKHPMYAMKLNLERYRTAARTLTFIFKEIENHCPCGARPEALHSHPHAISCPTQRGLLSIKLCTEADNI